MSAQLNLLWRASKPGALGPPNSRSFSASLRGFCVAVLVGMLVGMQALGKVELARLAAPAAFRRICAGPVSMRAVPAAAAQPCT